MKKIGRYDIVGEVGRGAMGVVYKASDPTIDRLVAIKVLSLEPSAEQGVPGARETFMREARAAGRLSHPGIVTIHDALEDPETHNNYIVMEYVPGPTLENILLSGLAFSTERALGIIRQVAEALDYAHRQRIIHRDMKPANILLTEDGRAKITDFGIAKVMAGEGSKRTIAVMGTPSYMSPEQVKGGDVDARSDLFSLGVVLYVMLTGQKPFVGDTAAVMFKVVYEDPVLPSELNSQLSPGTDYLVLRCLAKDLDQRYSNAREFLDDLEDVQHGRAPRTEAKFPLGELRVGERTVRTLPPMSARAESPGRGARGKSLWLAPVVGVGVLFVGALVGLGIWRSRHAATAPPAPPQGTTASAPAPLPAPGTSQSLSRPGVPPSAPPNGPAGKQKSPGGSKGKTAGTGAPLNPRPKVSAGATDVAKAASGAPPTVASTAVAPSPAAKPGEATPPAAGLVAGKSTAGARVVQLWCRHELKEGILTISSGAQPISQWPLKGKKKGGFMGIKGGYAGTLSRSISVPVSARELSVHVVSPDGALDLSRTISAIPPADASATLQVMIIGDQLTVNWQAPPHPKP